MTSWVRTDGSVRFFGIGSKCVLKRQVTVYKIILYYSNFWLVFDFNFIVNNVLGFITTLINVFFSKTIDFVGI